MLMFFSVWRTVYVRIYSDDLLVFTIYDGTHLGRVRTFFRSWFAQGWKGQSLFSWADKGEWTTVATPDLKIDRERNWFRIGFEPIFEDYTKPGTWLVMIMLAEVRLRVDWIKRIVTI